MKITLMLLPFLVGALFFAGITTTLVVILASSKDEKSHVEHFESMNLSSAVEAYREAVIEECELQEIDLKYVDVVLAIMQQESGGKVLDVMQSSESQGFPPNYFTDPLLSIHYGVMHFKTCLEQSDNDLDVTIQSYNYGLAFPSYAFEHGGWTLQVASDFSDMWASKLGWKSYGDKLYVPHVMRYLTFENGQIMIPTSPLAGDFQYPFVNVPFTVTSETGWRWGKIHAGMDLVAVDGAPVSVVASGVVTSSYYSDSYGNVVTVQHANGLYTRYAHMQIRYVQVGQEVKQGQILGKQGDTGKSKGSHLHFEIRTADDSDGENAKNPREYIQFPALNAWYDSEKEEKND